MEIGSFGAEHYYGKLCCDGKDVEIVRPMTQAEALKLNKKDDVKFYKAGHELSRFDTKEEIISIAKKVWKTHFTDGDFLILGTASHAEPQLVLAGCEPIISKANKIFSKYEKIGYIQKGYFYDRREEDWGKIKKLSRKWDDLFEQPDAKG